MVQLALAGVDRLQDADRVAIFDALGDERLSMLRASGRLAWLDIEHQVALNRGIRGQLGPDGFDAFWRGVTRRTTKEALFASFASGMIRVLGVSPAKLFKIIPRATDHVARDVGTYEVVNADVEGSLRVLHRDIPEVLRGDDTWVRAMCASLYVPLEMVRVDGTIALDADGLADGMVCYDVSWSSRDRAAESDPAQMQ
jgi:hypothetical protein